MIDQLPPQNIEAEEAIIGGILIDSKGIDRLPTDFTSEAFYVKAHKLIFDAALALHAQQQPVDFLTVSTALQDSGHLTAIGGIPTLTKLADGAMSAVNIDRYAGLVIKEFQKRELIAFGNTLIAMGYDKSSTWDEIAEVVESGSTSLLTNNQSGKGLVPLSEILVKLWNQVEAGLPPGKPTGLNFLDQCLNGGFRPGELVVIAGRPSMGKSFLGGFIGRTYAQNAPVVLFSLEMDDLSVARRMVGTESGIKQSDLLINKIRDSQAENFVQATSTLSQIHFYIDHTPGSQMTMNRLTSECRRIYRQHGQMGCVVVDYLQLIGDQGSKYRVGEIGSYSSALKSLAKELQCPVICLSQLSRECEKRNDKRPMMSDIRDSGAVEQDSDIIIFLYRDEYYNKNTEDAGIMELIIRKNRSGQTGTVKVEFNPEYGEIKNYVNYSF